MIQMRFLIIALAMFQAAGSQAVPTWCDSCGGSFNGQVVSFIDQVDKTKKWLCEPCADLTTVCYRCGIPVWKGYVTLSDGRVLCERDQVGIVLDEKEALTISRDVDRTLESLLGRFSSFPSTNVQVRLVDRIDVRALMGVAGYDFSCPNLLGYTLSLQKPGYLFHEIRLLNGLQKGVLQATYGHELAHAWISENVSKARELELKGDAAEGFCELIGYLVANAYRDDTARRHVLSNQYTRGQVLLFIEAERRFGMGDVFDWMKHGQTTLLRADLLAEIREVDMPDAAPPRPVSEYLFIPKTRARPRNTLELTSVTIGPSHSVATINGRAMDIDEERRIPLGGSNVLLRCLAIEPGSVLIEHVDSGRQSRLYLKRSGKTDTD